MLLKEREVAAHFNVARSSIRRWVSIGSFPKPLRIGERAVRWRQEDVEAFEQQAIEKRNLPTS